MALKTLLCKAIMLIASEGTPQKLQANGIKKFKKPFSVFIVVLLKKDWPKKCYVYLLYFLYYTTNANSTVTFWAIPL